MPEAFDALQLNRQCDHHEIRAIRCHGKFIIINDATNQFDHCHQLRSTNSNYGLTFAFP